MQLTAFVEALPSWPAAFGLTGRRADVGIPLRRGDEFVAPCLAPTAVSEPLGHYQVIGISAAGAVGKSTLGIEPFSFDARLLE